MPSIGGFIITFNRPKILEKTLQKLGGQTQPPELILVVDNGNSIETKLVVENFQHEKIRLIYRAMGENLGPAGAATHALQWLSEQEYEWIYWGDDDNPPWFPDTLERLSKLITLVNDSKDIGGVAAVGTLWNWNEGELRRLPDQALNGVINVDSVGGNQQLILRREVIQAVGLPDARLFFGLEEIEYCLRIRRAGYRLLVDGDLMREYRTVTGRMNLNLKRSLLPRYSYDSIWRRYYTTRNYIFLMNKTFGCPNLARREALKAFGRVVASWLYGPRYGLAFSNSQLRGVLDGYFGRLGRTIMPKPKYGGDHEQ